MTNIKYQVELDDGTLISAEKDGCFKVYVPQVVQSGQLGSVLAPSQIEEVVAKLSKLDELK